MRVTIFVFRNLNYLLGNKLVLNRGIALSASSLYLTTLFGSLHQVVFTRRPIDLCAVIAASIATSIAYNRKHGKLLNQ